MKYKLLLLVFAIALVSCKKEKKVETTEPEVVVESYEIVQGKHCFKQDVEKNILSIELIVEGNKVHGSFDYLPLNDKEDKGVFTGELKGNIASTVCTFTQDDKIKKEEVVFKVEAKKVSILGGEKKEIDGVWKFIDISKGFYMNDIDRINCKE